MTRQSRHPRMIEEISDLLDKYSQWLRDKNALREIGHEYIEITTPFLDRHNDYIQLYVKRENSGYFLTDGGETIEDLRSSGCDLDTKKRRDLLTATLNGFGVQYDQDALVVRATAQNFSLRKHNLIQAMLAVNDLFFLAVPMVASLFIEDVAEWLQSNEIRYIRNVRFAGKTGYDHTFDFVIPPSKRAPERLLRAVSHPRRDTAETMAFSWIDTREARSSDSKYYAMLNDEKQHPSTSILDALYSYEIIPVLWSKRENIRAELAA